MCKKSHDTETTPIVNNQRVCKLRVSVLPVTLIANMQLRATFTFFHTLNTDKPDT